jgi:hypothetical protein
MNVVDDIIAAIGRYGKGGAALPKKLFFAGRLLKFE